MLLRMLVLSKILIRHSICDETKRINRNFSLFGNCRMLWPCFIDLHNFILLVCTVSFFRKIIFISSYTEKNNYFLLYELIQDLPYSDPADQAEMLNSQFAEAFTKEDCNFMPQIGPSLSNTAPPLIIQEKGVKKLLDSQDPHKASGPDQITPRFLKEMAPSITPALTLIFQASFDQGQVPEDWKRANVTPLFKKGDKSKATNYRPVSLTSTCWKIMEHIVHSNLMNFLESNNILSDYQHGFWKKRSCETQLFVNVHDLAAGLDRHQQIDAIWLDSSKGFDKVPHKRLATKLQRWGNRNL